MVSHHIEVSVSAGWISSWMTGVEGFQASWPKRTSTKLGVTATYNSLLKREGKNRLDKYFCFVVEAGLLVVPCRSGRGEQEVFPHLTSQSWARTRYSCNPRFFGEWDAGETVRVSLSFTRVQERGLCTSGAFCFTFVDGTDYLPPVCTVQSQERLSTTISASWMCSSWD